MELTTEQKTLLKKYLSFMAGFEESTLYLDYMEAEDNFTDVDFENAVNFIYHIAEAK